MTDAKLLGACIERSGLKKNYIAREIGIAPATFRFKCRGDYQFTQNEIVNLTHLLRLSQSERDQIFFTGKVD